MVSVADFGLNTLDFDISLLSLVSNADTDESELVMCSCMISLFIYVMGFMPPLQRGGFSCAGPMAADRDKSTGLMLIMEYLFAGPGYGP